MKFESSWTNSKKKKSQTYLIAPQFEICFNAFFTFSFIHYLHLFSHHKNIFSVMIDENYGPQHTKHFSYNYLVRSTIKSTAKLFMKIYNRFSTLYWANRERSEIIGKVLAKPTRARGMRIYFVKLFSRLPEVCAATSKHIKANKNKSRMLRKASTACFRTHEPESLGSEEF